MQELQDRVRNILETFELPKRIEDRILLRVSRDIEFLCFTDFSTQYRYVARLVEEYQKPWEERIALSLDAPRYEDSDRTLHEKIADERYQNDESNPPIIYIDEAVNLSSSYMSEKQRGLVSKLIKRGKINVTTNEKSLCLNSEEIVADFLGITHRAEAVIKLLEDPRFRQPERRLIYVKLDIENPKIKLENRKYNGSPLAYFRKHSDVYERFIEDGRKALSEFDRGLYDALRKYKARRGGRDVKQIDLAIPEVKSNKEFDLGIQTRIVESYREFNGIARESARNLHFSLATILKYWSLFGLQPLGRKRGNVTNLLGREKQKRILVAYNIYSGNLKKAARELGHCAKTIRKYWRKEGLKPKGKSKQEMREVV